MKDFIRFTDAVTGHISLPNGSKYAKTKDSKSKSGHSLITQIEMTHAGIITGNLGFYLPGNMRDGAKSFTQNYNKPVLIGHDADTDPVGRVIDAKYIDTAGSYLIKDEYLKKGLYSVNKNSNPEKIVDYVQHIIKDYYFKDSYRGLGHILGTLKISDEETIAKILDNRYLTVSTALISTKAICSECGQDWIADGKCEHERGKVYDSGLPMVLITGGHSYTHLGIVSEPADEYAAGFKTVEIIHDGKHDSLETNINKEFMDKFSIVANLFSYNNNSLISLSDKQETNLFDVKDSIQEIQNSLKNMEKTEMNKKILDDISATISLWSSDPEAEKATSVEIRQYLKKLSPEEIADLAQKALALLSSEQEPCADEMNDALKKTIELELSKETTTTEKTTDAVATATPVVEKAKTKVISDKFKLVDGTEYELSMVDAVLKEITDLKDPELTTKDSKELATLIVKSRSGDALASITLDAKDKELKDIVVAFKDLKTKKFKLSEVTDKELVEKMNLILDENHKIAADATVEKTLYAGQFPVTNKEVAKAAKTVLGQSIASDSLKGRILTSIEKIASTFADEVASTEIEKTETTETFDTKTQECDNQTDITDEKVLEDLKNLLTIADERGIISDIIAPYFSDMKKEIEILEQQLDLVNDELDRLEDENQKFKDELKASLVEKVVDAKIRKGLAKEEAREEEVKAHLERSEDSLNDSLKDLEKMPVTETSKIADLQKIESPVLQDASTTSKDQVATIINSVNEEAIDKEAKIVDNTRTKTMQKYNLLKAQKGKAFADSWLAKQ